MSSTTAWSTNSSTDTDDDLRGISARALIRKPIVERHPFSRLAHTPTGEELLVVQARMQAASQRRRLALLREQADQS